MSTPLIENAHWANADLPNWPTPFRRPLHSYRETIFLIRLNRIIEGQYWRSKRRQLLPVVAVKLLTVSTDSDSENKFAVVFSIQFDSLPIDVVVFHSFTLQAIIPPKPCKLFLFVLKHNQATIITNKNISGIYHRAVTGIIAIFIVSKERSYSNQVLKNVIIYIWQCCIPSTRRSIDNPCVAFYRSANPNTATVTQLGKALSKYLIC